MNKFILCFLLSVQIIKCDFGDEVLRIRVDIPKNVTNVEQYKQNICEKIAEEQGR